MTPTDILELQEYHTSRLPSDRLSESEALQIWQRYGEKITINPPSFKNEYKWEIIPQGWVGHVPLTDKLHCTISPKTTVTNVFRMLDYAYNLQFIVDDGDVQVSTFTAIYESLAAILARRILIRSRKGFHREYVQRRDWLPFLRGKLALESMLSADATVSLDCSFQENTADTVDNRILLWTLRTILRSGICSENARGVVHRAYRSLQGAASLEAFSGRDCLQRHYTRLNIDYKPMHTLCRFFLEHIGPDPKQGDRHMLPFLVDMAALYETFVSEWLHQHLPQNMMLKIQAPIALGQANEISFRIDLLIVDRDTQRPVCLLDTKYKVPSSPSSHDLQQVIAYAKAFGCPCAVLVYPEELNMPFQDTVGGDIRVWTTSFRLAGDLEENGAAFLAHLLKGVE